MKKVARCQNCRRYLERNRFPKDEEKLWETDCSCCGYNHWDVLMMPDSLAVQPNIPMSKQTLEQLKEELAYWQSRPPSRGPSSYVEELWEWIERKEASNG